MACDLKIKTFHFTFATYALPNDIVYRPIEAQTQLKSRVAEAEYNVGA